MITPARPRRGFRTPDEYARTVSPHLPMLRARARAILGSDDLAGDAVQETLLRVWTRGWLPPRPARVLAHLVVRSSLHLLRCERRRRDHEDRAARETCCDDDPLRSLTRDEQERALADAVACLAAPYRSVFELFELEGHSYETIAGRLRLPVGTVRSRLSRARSFLRERLDPGALTGSPT